MNIAVAEKDDVAELRRENDELKVEVAGLEEENGSLEDKLDEVNSKLEQMLDPHDAIDAFLDVVERPVGRLKFAVPQSDAANRAILGLFDAVGRQP